ncbi:hypothetical protein PUN28_017467 [Cardiocondyla obscurior]|uniref:Uncharacterized protein n=1 Tax=Cardiocondyla obscurior TaxID=286306 RepID=A0AAW2EM54_9HYME
MTVSLASSCPNLVSQHNSLHAFFHKTGCYCRVCVILYFIIHTFGNVLIIRCSRKKWVANQKRILLRIVLFIILIHIRYDNDLPLEKAKDFEKYREEIHLSIERSNIVIKKKILILHIMSNIKILLTVSKTYFLSSFCFSASSNKASLKPRIVLAVRFFHEKMYSSSFSVSLLNREFSAILKPSICSCVCSLIFYNSVWSTLVRFIYSFPPWRVAFMNNIWQRVEKNNLLSIKYTCYNVFSAATLSESLLQSSFVTSDISFSLPYKLNFTSEGPRLLLYTTQNFFM